MYVLGGSLNANDAWTMDNTYLVTNIRTAGKIRSQKQLRALKGNDWIDQLTVTGQVGVWVRQREGDKQKRTNLLFHSFHFVPVDVPEARRLHREGPQLYIASTAIVQGID